MTTRSVAKPQSLKPQNPFMLAHDFDEYSEAEVEDIKRVIRTARY